MEPDLGIITLARSLDLSVRSEYELTIMANDKGMPQLSSTCIVRVKVTEADERPPKFESKSFTAELKENEPAGTFVIALNGESQSALTFSIKGGKNISSFLPVHHVSSKSCADCVFQMTKVSL